MGFMTIDGQRVEFTNEPNVLTVIRNAEIDIPTLCYHSELSIYGACRLCTVEDGIALLNTTLSGISFIYFVGAYHSPPIKTGSTLVNFPSSPR